MAPEIKTLISDIDAFLAQSGMSASTFGRETVNDGSFLENLRSGREPRFATVSKVRREMARLKVARDATKDSQALSA